jgi:hypothetical protein
MQMQAPQQPNPAVDSLIPNIDGVLGESNPPQAEGFGISAEQLESLARNPDFLQLMQSMNPQSQSGPSDSDQGFTSSHNRQQ